MFENAELGQKLDKAMYEVEAARLRADLLQAQRELATANFSVIVIVAGVGGAGKSETVNLLLEWLDARGIQTHAMRQPTDEEAQRPPMWRFWRALPAHGRMGIFFGAWDVGPLLDAIDKPLDRASLEDALNRTAAFEQMLTRENVLVVKFWLHLSKAAQKKQLKKLSKDPLQRWRVTKRDWKLFKHYDELRLLAAHLIRRTNTAEAPWTIVEGVDRRFRNVTVARTLLAALCRKLEASRAIFPSSPRLPLSTPPPVNVINQLNMSLTLDATTYKDELLQIEGDLNRLTRRLHKKKRAMILVFEGPDAAGKGGAIRRITAALDARDFRVISVAAPTDEEKAHPYLWRFWRQAPPWGRVAIYDRSWYGRVLVERVEGFAQPDEWQRAYYEINCFEEELIEHGALMLKFWLAITPEEQLRRFESREVTPYKQYKITPEDWRNREKWDAYEAAAVEMIEKTSTEVAPWNLVEANNKEWARIKVLRTIVERLRDAFD